MRQRWRSDSQQNRSLLACSFQFFAYMKAATIAAWIWSDGNFFMPPDMLGDGRGGVPCRKSPLSVAGSARIGRERYCFRVAAGHV
jgi:hypothetical protein